MESQPIDESKAQPDITHIAPAWKDSQTGALYVHRDLVRVQDAWAEEGHIGPMKVTKNFGDVRSFVQYVQQYGGASSLLTWNAHGLVAILDHAESPTTPGRNTWLACHPFIASIQWRAWSGFANGEARGQRAAVERLEDLSEDIVEPETGVLMALLRTLRSTVNAKAEAEFRSDGTTSVSFSKDATVRSAGAATLPAAFTIAIPALKGHTDDQERPVLYRLQVRVRVSIDDNARLSFRFTLPSAERVLEDVYADRVRVATALLGASFRLLRAAD